jgi:hypothetical protein
MAMRIFIRSVGQGRDLDMTPDGHFHGPAPLSVAERVFRAAVIVAIIAGGLGLAALAFWFALMLIPVAIVAGLLAWAALRWRLWREQRSFGGQRDPFRRF